jgi:hypothetical protein
MIDFRRGFWKRGRKVGTIKEFMVDRDGKRTAVELTQAEKQQLIEDLNIKRNTIQKKQLVTDQPVEKTPKNA